MLGQHREPLLEQFPYSRRITQRSARANLEPVHLAVGAEQCKPHQTRALTAPFQHAPEFKGDRLILRPPGSKQEIVWERIK